MNCPRVNSALSHIIMKCKLSIVSPQIPARNITRHQKKLHLNAGKNVWLFIGDCTPGRGELPVVKCRPPEFCGLNAATNIL